jgi:hypothetical protein
VIGVGVSNEHRQERFSQRIDAGAQGAALTVGERGVDGDDAVGALDQIGVGQDEAAFRLDRRC